MKTATSTKVIISEACDELSFHFINDDGIEKMFKFHNEDSYEGMVDMFNYLGYECEYEENY